MSECSCCHHHDHNHEHKSVGFKKEIIKLSVSAVFLIAAVLISSIIKELHPIIKLTIFALPYLIAALDVLREAAGGVLHGEFFSESLLMCIASIGAFIIDEYPEAVFVMIFFGVGELFEGIASQKSRKSITALMKLRPDSVNILRDGEIVNTAIADARLGDIMVISAGERIALDGVITEGETTLDLSALTGESLPIDASVGSDILSGGINLTGVIKVRVTSALAESTVSRILNLVENSSEKKAKAERFITKFSRIYTPAVVIAAILLATLPSIIWGTPSKWIYRALMFLVVSCPCALVLSVPLCYFGGLGAASKKGILIKGAEYLDTLTNLTNAVFDKTGTLTSGRLSVESINPIGISKTELLRLAATAEYMSNHPIAMSLKEACGPIDTANIKEACELSAHGIYAEIDRQAVLVGNRRLMESNGITPEILEDDGTIIHIARDGQYLGNITMSDTLKPDTKTAIERLRESGITTAMLTGDRRRSAEKIAREIGIDSFAYELLPEDKVTHLEGIIGGGTTAFVGDGINDAPCLARADIGIAMGGIGSDASIEAADIVIMNDSINSLPTAIQIAQKTRRVAAQSIAFSIAVKLLVLLLSALGLTSMWFAAFADVGVMVIAVLNASRTLIIK